MAVVFGGVGVALVTLFGADGEVDAVATGKHAADLASRGVAGVLVCGTTAEAATLTEAERVMLIEAVRAALPESVPVIAGTGAPSARQAVTLTRMAVAAGADAMLTWCPVSAAGPLSPAALAGFYAEIADAAGALLALANLAPEACLTAFGGDASAQRDLAAQHLPVSRGGIPQLKRMLAETAGLSPVCRIW